MSKIRGFELVRKSGSFIGRYRLRTSDGRTELYPGANFINGETTDPVTGAVAARLEQAFGLKMTIEPYDAETLNLVVAQLRDRGQEARAATLEGATVRAAEPEPDDDDELPILTRIELMEEAKALGLTPAWNTGEARLRELIRGHRDRVQAGPDPDSDSD